MSESFLETMFDQPKEQPMTAEHWRGPQPSDETEDLATLSLEPDDRLAAARAAAEILPEPDVDAIIVLANWLLHGVYERDEGDDDPVQ